MPNSRSFVLDFGIKVFVPSVAAAAGIALLLLHVFNGIFEETNNLDDTYARRSANAAIASLRENMEALILDNAYWDDAVRNAYGNGTADWLKETWGAGDEEEVYDAAFVVNADGATIFASTSEDPDNLDQHTIQKYFSHDINVLLAKLPRTGTSFAKTSGILKSEGGLSVVAAATIVPSTQGTPIPGGRPSRLVLAYTISPAVLARVSEQFVLDNLQLMQPGENLPASIDILSPSEEKLAALTWKTRSPGMVLRNKFDHIVRMVLSVFLLMVAVLVYFSWRGFKQAHESKAKAIAASIRDDLTGLPNRRELMAVLAGRLAAVRAGDGQLSLVYADLDGFKEVNDAYGHEIGDQLLQSVAAGFAYLAQGADIVSRLGGDEFAIILSGPESAEQARQLARNMIAFLAEPMQFGGRVASVSVSTGIVDLEKDDAGGEEILRRADAAMYAAKAAGRNRIHIYEASLESKRDERRMIARELREAVEGNKLGVVYQPIVNARTRRTVGVEALVRWPHDSKRQCTPDIFVPIAEEFGLIEELGRFVLVEACSQAARWPDIFVSVNVSPIQFINPAFADIVEATLRETGLAAYRLEIEVTEGFVIDNTDRATAIIDRLHEMKVSVALDDFGTGYSSIGHLRRFKFDKLKLDRSMVVDILLQPAALRLVQGTIAMADALGLRVTAEGIDDENQVSVLRLAGCSLLQGFLFSEPLEAHEVMDFLDPEAAAIAV
ncbi:MAG: bifunctional diguanylate cyclase/phosphodiesterase [Rhizobiales bacterium]|nr:bifunctional diguanylate cyclase/phosphodiesterase [Hyphomicrobiales bacterium]